MRKIVLIIIAFTLLLLGCSNSQSLQAEEPLVSSGDMTTPKPKEYVITHGAYENWDQYQLSDFLQNDLVQTEESAIAIANAIVKNAVGEQEWKKLYLANVWEDAEREVWIISYYTQSEDANVIMVGGEVYIAIRKHDAQVVKMWAEE